MRLYGEWAQLELEKLARLLPAGGTVLDIGAFVGSHTLAFARMVGPQGQVHSFEPRSAIRQLLQSNVDRNGLSQVRVHGCALGRSEATLEIPSVAASISSERAVNFGGLALREAEDKEAQPVERVAIRPLDSFAFEQLDLIKIDAEGMEPDVIAGAGQTLARHRPVIFAECNDLEGGAQVLRAFQDLDCAVLGSVEPAYNPANFLNNAHNVFGEAGEAALLAVPRERLPVLHAHGSLQGLAPIESIDALALLMLHKAQYPFEVLAASSAAGTLGLRYASPLSRMMEEEVRKGRAELAACSEHAQATAARLGNTEALLSMTEARLKQEEQRALAAESYRSSSLRWWLGRLRRRISPAGRP
ncbi:FkbM family methyltransferase [Ramlibacter ginsenosidimutans]|uniref:FkbM family methyltransferase n=1 Tax=Ramlibacter ginsenosidimutans TaxID=502333 RepID=A0A934TNH4_9BURK|nr:FkbM family methyltransferase [Ramlibacter ginsenosidimutans]MBK6004586.1 FkbM family methyltransferase [Ramlibacter ginsenosidimutans]